MASAGKIIPLLRGPWAIGENYRIFDITYFEGSSYIAKGDINNSTIDPKTDETNWQIHAHGYIADTLADISATDTSGVLGTAGETVYSQALIDAIADKVMTKLIPYTNIVDNFLATDPNTVLSGPMGKALKDQIDTTNSNLNTLRTTTTFLLSVNLGLVAAYSVEPTNIYTIPQSTLDAYNILGSIVLQCTAQTSADYVLTVKVLDNVVQAMTTKTQNYALIVGLLVQAK